MSFSGWSHLARACAAGAERRSPRGLAALVAEIRLRLLDEPHLLGTHGACDAGCASRAGRLRAARPVDERLVHCVPITSVAWLPRGAEQKHEERHPERTAGKEC